jgi:hypothetical protein
MSGLAAHRAIRFVCSRQSVDGALVQLALGINVGAFLEQLANPAAIDLPFPRVIGDLALQQAEPSGNGSHSHDAI